MVGYVEFGIDLWIVNIIGMIMENCVFGLIFFVWMSFLMFMLRFFVGLIVYWIFFIGLLFVSVVCGVIGFFMIGNVFGIIFCFIVVMIYGFGKIYFWLMMLGVVLECYFKGGVIMIGVIGGVGMFLVGFLGIFGIGYKQDYYVQVFLKEMLIEIYDEYKILDNLWKFLFFIFVDGFDLFKVEVVKVY